MASAGAIMTTLPSAVGKTWLGTLKWFAVPIGA
jgi:hypothetical protein